MNKIPVSIVSFVIVFFSFSMIAYAQNNSTNNTVLTEKGKRYCFTYISKVEDVENGKDECKSEDQHVATGLQYLEVIVTILGVLLAFISLIGVIAGYFLKKLHTGAENALEDANQRTEEAEERIENYYKDFDALANEAGKKIDEANEHLIKLDKTDLLTKAKIDAIQKTLITCLNMAPDRNVAFSTYSNLLSAYDVLLYNGDQEVTPAFEEEMEIAATRIQGNKQYVPHEIIEFIIEHQNLPFDVKEILMSNG